jgi:hypothetical protein
VRERNRRAMVAAKSRRASPRELREAKDRVKELAEEMKEMSLRRETVKGEDRESRYGRVLRIRAMREQFEYNHPYNKRPHANSLLLALVMFAASFALCSFMAGGAYVAVNFITSKPDPVPVGDSFWTSIEKQDYNNLYDSYFATALRVTNSKDVFVVQAGKADQDYGTVSAYTLAKDPSGKTQVTINGSTATLVYTVTRGPKVHYSSTLTLQLTAGTWFVADLGAAIEPQLGGAQAPPATPTP